MKKINVALVLLAIGLWQAPEGYSQPFSYNDNGYTGYGPVLGGPQTGWVFNLTQTTNTFRVGDNPYGLLYVSNITADHYYTVQVWKEGTFLYDYIFGTNVVSGTAWARSYCWGEMSNPTPGNWAFKIFITYGGVTQLVDTLPFTVVETSGYKPFTYNDTAYAGYGPILGGATNGWIFSLSSRTNVFKVGDHPYALLWVNNISADHYYKVEVWKEGSFLYNYIFGTNIVSGVAWERSYCWGEMANPAPGNYAFKFFITYGVTNTELLDTVPFTVAEIPDWKPFSYDDNGQTGYGPLTGGATNGWIFNLAQAASVFQTGDHVYGLLHVTNVSVDHIFTVEILKEGVLVHSYVFGTNLVQGGTWPRSYCWAELDNASLGNWAFRISVTYSNTTEVLDTLPFTVGETPPIEMPILAIRRGETNSVILSWPATFTGFALQSRESLAPGVPWQTIVGTTQTLTDNTWQVRLPRTDPQQFFRLIK